MREKKLMEKPFHVRLSAVTQKRLETISDRTGLDRTTVARLALHSGLTSIFKNLPLLPAAEDANNNSGN